MRRGNKVRQLVVDVGLVSPIISLLLALVTLAAHDTTAQLEPVYLRAWELWLWVVVSLVAALVFAAIDNKRRGAKDDSKNI